MVWWGTKERQWVWLVYLSPNDWLALLQEELALNLFKSDRIFFSFNFIVTKMKSLSNDDNSNNNWLGFSLSPHINSLEGPLTDHHHSTQPGSSSDVQTSVPIRFSPTHLNYPAMYYEGDNATLFSSLSAMPLKSDGSLCIMKGFNRSQQPQGFCSKLAFFKWGYFLFFCDYLWNLLWLYFWRYGKFNT